MDIHSSGKKSFRFERKNLFLVAYINVLDKKELKILKKYLFLSLQLFSWHVKGRHSYKKFGVS